ncbi:response regulator transcription factor [Actinospica sp. MGRD01-02]|uniref:Response regulator transcription factor n=1 Tax=Actinospica acidithermotolerans TaxID=2828514 RepID=A0A941IGV1_9ACTN|nr:response regulator transcription factor [Actinospica acidithermotolerans]MBR7825042.1 response regulator transcription factor [Actinospica acidithermotolerans]
MTSAQPSAALAPRPPSGGPWRILVVDDEPDLVEVVCGAVRYEQWSALGVSTGAAAVCAAADWRPHAVVLDVMLPDLDGVEVMRRIHAEQPDIRVLFLTARDAVEDRVAGITAGGDDYVTKPFALSEVIARLHGLLRRAGAAAVPAAAEAAAPLPPHALVVGDLVLDDQAREVTRGGVPVELSPTEFALLRYLMEHPRQVLSKAQILEEVWSYDFGGDAHVVELYISYLRKKLHDGRPPVIHTVRGMGYVLRAAAS